MNKTQLSSPSTDNAQACKRSVCHSLPYILFLDFAWNWTLSACSYCFVFRECAHDPCLLHHIALAHTLCVKMWQNQLSQNIRLLQFPSKNGSQPMLENSWIKEMFNLLYYQLTSADCICPVLWLVRSATKRWHFIFQAREEKAIVGLIHAFRKTVDDRRDIDMNMLLCNNFSGQLPAFILNVV